MIQENIVSFETAKLAKEKGFFIKTRCYYNSDNPLSANIELKEHSTFSSIPYGEEYTEKHGDTKFLSYQIETINNAPTQALLQKWLRDAHHIYVTALPSYTDNSDNKKHFFEVSVKGRTMQFFDKHDYTKTYEESLEIGLQEALKLIGL